MSEIRQSGASFSISSWSCWSSITMALINCLLSIEVTLFRLSESSGKPTSLRGNVTVTTSTSKPKSLNFTMDFKKVGLSRGVAMRVDLQPLMANSLAMSIVRIMWPIATKRKKKWWSWWLSLTIWLSGELLQQECIQECWWWSTRKVWLWCYLLLKWVLF